MKKNFQSKWKGWCLYIKYNHKINWIIHDNARTVITACRSKLSTNNTKTLQITLTTKEVNNIKNLLNDYINPNIDNSANQAKIEYYQKQLGENIIDNK